MRKLVLPAAFVAELGLVGCGDNDTVGTGLSGWIIGLLVGILLLALIMAALRHRR